MFPPDPAEQLRLAVDLAAAIDGEPPDRLQAAAEAYVRWALADPARFLALVAGRSLPEIPGREGLRELFADSVRARGWSAGEAEGRFGPVWCAVHETVASVAEEPEGVPTGAVVRLVRRQLAALLAPCIADGPVDAPSSRERAPATPRPPVEAAPADPQIYDFLHYRDYVREWLRGRSGHPSLRGLAAKVGCSASLLSAVLAGDKELNEFHVQDLAGALGLDEKGRRYFDDLVESDRPGPIAKRSAARDRLTATRRFIQSPRLADLAWLLFRHWYMPAICELVLCEGFRDDPEWIAATLRPTITPTQARQALETLLSVGLLARDAEGRLRPSTPVLLTDHEVTRAQSLAVWSWHLWLTERAAHALESLPATDRHFAAATFAASPALVADLKKHIAQFMEQSINRSAAHPEPRTRVYQFALQMFPLSEELPGPTGS